MKFLLLATFVALATATALYKNKSISIGDDGSILITTPYGRRVYIQKPVGTLDGDKNVEITVSGPNVPTKTIRIGDSYYGDDVPYYGQWSSLDGLGEEYRLKRSSITKGKTSSQGDVLSAILKEYQGVVDDVQYEKLLTKVDKAVKKGEISPQIYDLLENIDQITGQGSSGVDSGVQGIVPLQRQLGYGYGVLPGVDSGIGRGYGYEQVSGSLPWWYPRSQYQYGQSSYIPDLLVNQQQYGGVYSSYLPQRVLPSYQQLPYSQLVGQQRLGGIGGVGGVEQVPWLQYRSVPWPIRQLSGLPQSYISQYGRIGLSQPISRPLGYRSIQPVQGSYYQQPIQGSYYQNTLPQVPLVY